MLMATAGRKSAARMYAANNMAYAALKNLKNRAAHIAMK